MTPTTVEAKLVYEPEKSMAKINNHLQQLLLQKKEPPRLPGSHRFRKQTWLTPLLSKVDFPIKRYLHEWGLLNLLVFAKHYDDMFIHWEAISALIEIWHPQTHTFIFPSFEATILIEETELFLGLKQRGIQNRLVAHSVVKPTAKELIFMITKDHVQTRNIAIKQDIKLNLLAKWIMQAKEQRVDDEKIAQALSLCLAGLFYFPSQNDILDEEFLDPIQSAWHGKSLAQPILAYLYSGLSFVSLEKPFYGSMILLDMWLSFHIKLDFGTHKAISNPKSYTRSLIFKVKDALRYPDLMILKTIHLHSRSDWRKFISELRPSDFAFSSEVLPTLKVRPFQGIDLRLVGSKELVLYNAHRCHLCRQQKW